MKRQRRVRYYLVSSLVLLLLIFAVCIGWARIDKSTPEYNGKVSPIYLTVKKNASFVISLPAVPSTGYAWTLDVSNHKQIVEKTDKSFVPNSPGLVGESGYENWEFFAKQQGTEPLIFTYSRPWETNLPPTDVKLYYIIVNE